MGPDLRLIGAVLGLRSVRSMLTITWPATIPR
jgi:hypothetical protein